MRRKSAPLRGETGFSLVELLSVISIISVLSSMGIVASREVRERAQISGSVQIAQNLITAYEDYFASNENPAVSMFCQSFVSGATFCPSLPQISFGKNYNIISHSTYMDMGVRQIQMYSMTIRHKNWGWDTYTYVFRLQDEMNGVVLSSQSSFVVYKNWQILKRIM